MNVSYKTAKLFLEGDEVATAEVYRNYKKLLYFIIVTYVRRKEDCDDVYQNIFLKLLSNRNEIKEVTSLHQYLCITAKNEAINYSKRQSKDEPRDNLDDVVQSSSNNYLDYLLPYNLTEEEKCLVGYKVAFDLRWQDIASILETPVPTLKKKYSLAMKKIKEVYKK